MMVLPLIMKTEKKLNKKNAETNSFFLTFKKLQEKLTFFKIAARAFEAGDLLNIFLRFSGF